MDEAAAMECYRRAALLGCEAAADNLRSLQASKDDAAYMQRRAYPHTAAAAASGAGGGKEGEEEVKYSPSGWFGPKPPGPVDAFSVAVA